jgi:NAD(P)-dependent dehydrogenase (short-subunit alcohol dehydrogenase family)
MILKEKVVVITGGSKGLGLELSKLFTKQGAKVVISSRNKAGLENVAKEFGLDYLPCDVTVEQEVKKLSDEVIKKYGGYDIWINNAGIIAKSEDFLDMNTEDVRKMFETNFFGYWFGAQVSIRHFVSKNSGTLVNINSSSALEGKKDIIGYSASKYAVKGLTDGLEKYLNGKNITQVNVYPGGIQTEFHKENNPPNFSEYFTVEHVAQLIVDNLLKDNSEKELKILRGK